MEGSMDQATHTANGLSLPNCSTQIVVDQITALRRILTANPEYVYCRALYEQLTAELDDKIERLVVECEEMLA